jgi:hypothetical protein
MGQMLNIAYIRSYGLTEGGHNGQVESRYLIWVKCRLLENSSWLNKLLKPKWITPRFTITAGFGTSVYQVGKSWVHRQLRNYN